MCIGVVSFFSCASAYDKGFTALIANLIVLTPLEVFSQGVNSLEVPAELKHAATPFPAAFTPIFVQGRSLALYFLPSPSAETAQNHQ
jgi:hypothetical protein